jgi:F420H(2)-dependent quinone reductase
MAGATTDEAKAFNKEVIEEFRANEGRVSGFSARTPIVRIHHIGAQSGIERLTSLACFPLGDDRYAIVSSDGGSPTHPDW